MSGLRAQGDAATITVAEVQRISDSTGFLFAHVMLPDGNMATGFVEDGTEEGDSVEWKSNDEQAHAKTPAKRVRARSGERDGEHKPIKQVHSVTEALTSGEQIAPGYTVSSMEWESLLPESEK